MTKSNTSKKRKAHALREAEEDEGWIVECPAQPDRLKRQGVEDVFKDNDHPGVEELAIDYTIRPGSKWSSMRGYSNVKYQGQNFARGDCIVVNKTDPPPRPPREDAPPEEVLKYQRDNSWIGRIQQAKADNANEVWLRVFWFYWPEELPMGVQQYHGQSELILSNYTDIIDANAISGKAEVSHWDESKDGDEEPHLNALYWRQIYNLTKVGPKKKGGLSVLRKHCICRQEYNPDKTMFKCSKSATCGSWNHLECLEKELRSDLSTRLKKRTLKSYLDKRAATYEREQREKQRSLGNTIAVGIANAANRAINAMHRIEGTDSDVENEGDNFDTNKALHAPSKKSTTNDIGPAADATTSKNLQISISTAGSGTDGGDEAVVAEIKLLPLSAGEKDVHKWTIKLDCLKCNKPLD